MINERDPEEQVAPKTTPEATAGTKPMSATDTVTDEVDLAATPSLKEILAATAALNPRSDPALPVPTVDDAVGTASAVVTAQPRPEMPRVWAIVSVKLRVDSFNQAELVGAVQSHIQNGVLQIALDLRANRFLSTAVIRFCAETANELAARGGRLVIVGCSERMKRHFEAYGSLRHMRFARTFSELGLEAPGFNGASTVTNARM